ncbi:MAG TPA: NAD-dependent epimerase [Verrucomicrobiales bacterium]|nr:NAD-dependent epimerase [Verrucomicrobiales bacterium]
MQVPRHRPAHVPQADESNLVPRKPVVHRHGVIPNETAPHCKPRSPPCMKVLITGGGGFLGSQLCRHLLQRGTLTGPSGTPEPIREILLFDAHFHSPPSDPRVRQVHGDISNREAVIEAVGTDPATSLFHLASMVSGECEERFDDALRVNLDGGRNVFEAARALPGLPRLVFASSIACFGGTAMQDPNTDQTKLTPQTTYGMTKAICELLVNDHSRKGHFDGRSARLPTVIIRPGKPNAAASGWASGMFREPLRGEPCRLPVRRDQRHPMTGYRTVIESLVALHEVPASRLGEDRAIGLPAHQVTPRIAESVLAEVGQARGLSLGPITEAFDPRIQRIVDGWPVAVDGARATALGFPAPPPLRTIVEDYLEDFATA